MTKKLLSKLSLGERYLWASILYTGLSLLLLGIAPEMPKAFACPACPEGQVVVQYGETCECECPAPGPDPVDPPAGE